MLSLSSCWTLLLQEDQSKPQETLENSPTSLENLVLHTFKSSTRHNVAFVCTRDLTRKNENFYTNYSGVYLGNHSEKLRSSLIYCRATQELSNGA